MSTKSSAGTPTSLRTALNVSHKQSLQARGKGKSLSCCKLSKFTLLVSNDEVRLTQAAGYYGPSVTILFRVICVVRVCAHYDEHSNHELGKSLVLRWAMAWPPCILMHAHLLQRVMLFLCIDYL